MSKPILLTTLEQSYPDLQMPDGRIVPIKAIDGIGMQLLMSIADDGSETQSNAAKTARTLVLWDVARRCLPDLSEEDVRSMTLFQVDKIVSIAAGPAIQVMESLGEQLAPAPAGAAAPSIPTPSAT